jgi:hypothetical protein
MKVKFLNYNQMDNMYLDVDVMSQDVIFACEKRDESNEGTFFIRIYSDGFADFGHTVDCDSWHDNQPYTWSSNPECINKVFGLTDKLRLAKYTIGVRDDDSCYIARGITFERACEIALDNEELLHYGYMKFFCNNHTF